ncbi:MAG: hypothetical protein EAZ15_09690 [Sphingobacteriales bacterium]|nr:MAG: hypothetical protein EAZ15_09690 [Sphingobacteriales bacterium]
MDDYLLNILNQSNKVIDKLQLLSVFFDDEEVVYKIYLRTQVIHKLFENNLELDAGKLELFHLQFTTSILELLKRIKKNNEGNVSLVYDEIQLNEDLIDKMNDSVYTEKNFNLDKQKQTLKINTSLRNLFQILSTDSSDFPFAKNITSFSARYAKDYFYDIEPDKLNDLLGFENQEVYVNNYATIQKKLMGVLCKYDFKTEFFCGLNAGNLKIEIYKFIHTDKYFLFAPSRNLFLFCEIAKITEIDKENTLSRKAKIIQELQYKNDKLQSSVGGLKTYIPLKIKELLVQSYHKIADTHFLDNLSNADIEANVLKTMLNTNAI